MAALQVDRRRGDLFNYLIFLRVTPILPNIFINIASPVVDVPLRPFALGALQIVQLYSLREDQVSTYSTALTCQL